MFDYNGDQSKYKFNIKSVLTEELDMTNVQVLVLNTFFFLYSLFFTLYVMALVILCNTVNRIGLSLFHTQTVCESNQPA